MKITGTLKHLKAGHVRTDWSFSRCFNRSVGFLTTDMEHEILIDTIQEKVLQK